MDRRINRIVVCVRNEGYEAALELRKIYQAIPDTSAAQHQLLRVIDESGEDYLYPQNFFVPTSGQKRWKGPCWGWRKIVRGGHSRLTEFEGHATSVGESTG